MNLAWSILPLVFASMQNVTMHSEIIEISQIHWFSWLLNGEILKETLISEFRAV